MGKSGQIKIIQALRGIAALMVMVYHKRVVLNTTGFAFGEFFFGAGAMGVDLFFIISGFIMVMVNERRTTNVSPGKAAWQFFVNRVTRILPLYYFTIVLFFVIVWQGWGFLQDSKSVKDIVSSFFFIPLDAGKAAPFYGYAAITVGWTLNYEMFFYGLLTIGLLFDKYKYVVFSAALLILLVLVPLLFRGYVSFDAQNHYHFWSRHILLGYLNLMTNPIIWEFASGMLLGAWYVHRKTYWSKSVYYVLLSFFIVWVGFCLFAKWNSGHGMTHWGLPLWGLVATFVFYENQYGIQVPKSLLFFGKISFSLYLLHPIVQYCTLYFFNHHGLIKWNTTPIYIVASSLLTILAATVTQFLIEARFPKILKKLMS
ncbi:MULTISPECIES: acyltransferase family protein [Chitinophagaceae]